MELRLRQMMRADAHITEDGSRREVVQRGGENSRVRLGEGGWGAIAQRHGSRPPQ